MSVPAFDAQLTFDEATVAERLVDAEDAKDDIALVRDTLPLAGAIGGALLALGGAALLRRRPDEIDHVETAERIDRAERWEPEPEPAAPREDVQPLHEQVHDVASDPADETTPRRDDLPDAEEALDDIRSLSDDADLPSGELPPRA